MLPQERIYKNGSTAHNACYGAVKSNTPPPLLLDILHSWPNVRCLLLFGRSYRNYSFNLPMACSCRNYNHLNYEKTCIPISQFLFTLCFACWGDRQVPPTGPMPGFTMQALHLYHCQGVLYICPWVVMLCRCLLLWRLVRWIALPPHGR